MIKSNSFLIALLFFAFSHNLYSQTIIDTRGLPNPPEGCEIGLSVDTLDSCYSDNSVHVTLYGNPTECGPFLLNFGDGTIITTTNFDHFHNYCDTGTYNIFVMFANYYTANVPSKIWRVNNNNFNVNFSVFVDSTCYPATYAFVNTSKCIAPEFDTIGRQLNFIWSYGDGSPYDTAFNGSHQYFAKSNSQYTVTLTGYINNCAVVSKSIKLITLPWDSIEANFYKQNPLYNFKYLCENEPDTSLLYPTNCGYTYVWHPGIFFQDSITNNPIFKGGLGDCFERIDYDVNVDVYWNNIHLYDDYFTYGVFKDISNIHTINSQTQALCAGVITRVKPYKAIECGTIKYFKWNIPNININDDEIAEPLVIFGDTNSYTFYTNYYNCNIKAFKCSETSFNQRFLVLGKELPPSFGYTRVSGNTYQFLATTPFGTSDHQYYWDFGNGKYDTGANVVLQNLAGDYYVKLTVKNSCGKQNSSTILIHFDPVYSNYNKNNCTNDNSFINYTYNGNLRISTNQLWSVNNRAYNGIITIDSATTLTINGITIQFGMNSKIIVSRGGRLVIQNSILKGVEKIISLGDTCKGMWQGIEVYGNPLFNHITNLNNHGKLSITGNSKIYDAHIAIFVGKKVACIPQQNEFCSNTRGYLKWDPNYGGGIIEVQDVEFRRNAIDIEFSPYIPNTGNPNINANRIRNNKFYGGKTLDPGYDLKNTVSALPYPNVNNRYYAEANNLGRTSRQIKAYKIYNIGIYDNIFNNAVYGIDLIDTKASIKKLNSFNGNEFERLDFGISSMYTFSGINYPQTILGNSFNKIKTAAIKIDGGKIIQIKSNKFGTNLNPVSNQSDNPRGIYMYAVSNFSISDNNFYRLDTAIIILESGIEGGKINADPSGNTFTQCKQGVMTSGENFNLQIRCNDYINLEPNEYINRNWNIAGILPNQGSGIDHTSPSGNEFLPPENKAIFSTSPFYYYAHSRAEDNSFATLPTVASGSIGWDVNHIQNTGFVKQNSSCITIPPCSPNCDQALQLNSQRRQSLLDNYEEMMSNLDGGNTILLLSSLTSNTISSNELKNILIENSPLSEEVMSELINNFQKLTQQDLASVFELNLPVQDQLWEDISYYLIPNLSTSTNNFIKALQYGAGEFETLYSLEQQYINELNNQQQILEEIVLTEIAAESPEQAEIRLAKETNSNKQTSISSYLAKGDFVNANSIIQELEITNEADQDWLDMASIPTNLLQAEKLDWNYISNTQEEIIQQFAVSSYSPIVHANARAILYLLYGTEFPLVDQNHTWNSSRKAYRDIKKHLTNTQTLFNPFPNPTKNVLNIPYLCNTDNCSMLIYDFLGKEIEIIRLEKGYHTKTIETTNLAAGVFVILMKDGSDNKINYKKFVVQK